MAGTTRGRRVYCGDDGRFWLDAAMTVRLAETAPGDYWCYRGRWAAKLPNGLRCGLANHQVTEHSDGTVTVSPSILCRGGVDGSEVPELDYHGWLERGAWREA
jgi:hypothetical protein